MGKNHWGKRRISNLIKSTEKLQMGKNTVGKGEIAHYEHFFLFPQYF